MFRLVLGVTLVASVAVTLAADAPLSIEADAATQVKADAPIPIKVVVVTMFERGADTGDDPGEFQFWVEREKLDTVYAMPAGFRDARGDGHGLLAICTGIGTARAAASVMALGLDPRFDLRQAYWVVAGIAGVDPADASVGSAAWAEWVVDGDLAFEIDGRELAAGVPSGITPLTNGRGAAFHLDPALVDWAVGRTSALALPDTDGLKASRGRYVGSANAQRPPFVLKGDTISGGRFWHGALMNDWANAFVREMSGGTGNYVTTGMEDTGTLQSLTFLARAGRVDARRVLVLRTASNYAAPPPGLSAAQSLEENHNGNYSGYREALEAAYRVGSTVVHDLLKR
ncbi:MAG: purine nucleoside permease [Vicinamibacterales bacterium]